MPIASPCIGICIVDAKSVCIGCRRTIDEIIRWSQATDKQKQAIIDAGRARGIAAALPMQTIKARVNALPGASKHCVDWKHLAIEICRIQNSITPLVVPRLSMVFADGQSAIAIQWPYQGRFAGAVINAAPMDAPSLPDLMTRSQFVAAWKVGISQSDSAACTGTRVVTASAPDQSSRAAAASLISVLCHFNDPGAKKSTVALRSQTDSQIDEARLRRALSFRDRDDWKGLGTAIASYPIIAMAGFFVRSGQQGMIMILDNFNAAAAALLAERIYPGTARMMIATAGMDMAGYQSALAALKLKPIPIQTHALPDMLDSIQECLAD